MPDNQVTYTHTTASVDNTDTIVLAANTDRKYARIQNDDPALILWLMVGAAAVANEGMRLGPDDVFEMTQAKNNVDPAVINGIASAVGPMVALVAEA